MEHTIPMSTCVKCQLEKIKMEQRELRRQLDKLEQGRDEESKSSE